MKKLGIFITVLSLLLSSNVVMAAGKSAPKTTGDVGYNAGGLERNAEFNTQQLSTAYDVWNVNGTYTIAFEYMGTDYVHDATISNQSGNNYDVAGGYPSGGPFTYAWSGTGVVSGNTITNSVDYTLGAPGTHMDMTGTIAPDGSIVGTWTDNFGGARAGTWRTLSGNAQLVSGYDGKGNFSYSDANGDWYQADVKYVKVNGTDAFFAGLVTSASQPSWVGNWVQVADHDGGEPAYLVDQIWGIFTDENTAKFNVANEVHPGTAFAITSGNLQVH